MAVLVSCSCRFGTATGGGNGHEAWGEAISRFLPKFVLSVGLGLG